MGTGTLNGNVATFTTNKLSPGSHAITVAYRGDDNFLVSTSAALTQTVLSAAVQSTLLANQVNSLTANGMLSSGDAGGLTTTLNAARAGLNAGNVNAGINLLKAFINQVNALVSSHRLANEWAQTLIDEPNEAIDSALFV